MMGTAFDLLLAVTLLWVAWSALAHTDLFRSVVLFIAFGLLMALVWVRLQAPDIALAEAAVGAGLTGALLLDAVGHLRGIPPTGGSSLRKRGVPGSRRSSVWMGAAALLFAIALAIVLFVTPPSSGDLAAAVAEHLARSGVEHPITAVLLNFRGYDTLLEIGVLLLAVFAVLALQLHGDDPQVRPAPTESPLLAALVRGLVPLMLLVSGYLLWAGSHSPGGAFQAGAVLAGAGVLLRLSGLLSVRLPPSGLLRAGLLVGFAVFFAVGFAVMLGGNAFLEYPEAWAGQLILLIEAALTLSIGLMLVSLFSGAPSPLRDVEHSERSE